jgi:beta-glucosidase-like glycosyl hydrolase
MGNGLLLISVIKILLTLNSTATRILASWYLLRQDSPSYPPVSFSFFEPDSDQYNTHVDVQDSHFKLVREMGAASTVLLKNKNNVLPLGEHAGKSAERNLVLIGSDAGPGRMGPNEFSDQGGVITGTLAMGWGSGTANFTYLISVSSPVS